jgi:hypothetical protein
VLGYPLRDRRDCHFGAVDLIAQPASLGQTRLAIKALLLDAKLHDEDGKRSNKSKDGLREESDRERQRGQAEVARLLVRHDGSHGVELGECAKLQNTRRCGTR